MRHAFSPSRIPVDFNEMISADLVLLSARDAVVDSSGAEVVLAEGMTVHLYMHDEDEAGNPDPLVASGVVERNSAPDWSAHVRWRCRIDSKGIKAYSEL